MDPDHPKITATPCYRLAVVFSCLSWDSVALDIPQSQPLSVI